MLKKVVLALVVVVLALVVVVATRPAEFAISRSIGIATPPEVPYGIVSDFHKWSAFSPWAKLDPNQKETYSGAERGVGAMYAWDGNDDVGAGSMTIAAAKENARIDIALEFLRPFAASNKTAFTFEPTGTETRVTWSMSGHNNFLSKAFSMMVDMDAMIGKDFETGLAALKTTAEAELQKIVAEKVAAEEKARLEAAAAAAAAEAAPADAAQAAVPAAQ